MKISVRLTLAILINALIIPVVVFLSVVFYQQFKDALDERVLLHLSSIQRLKKIQLEKYILEEKEKIDLFFENRFREKKQMIDSVFYYSSSEKSQLAKYHINLDENTSHFQTHTLDATHVDETGAFKAFFWKKLNIDSVGIYLSKLPQLQKILDENTGLGQTGETYLVGKDRKMRSNSRFLSKPPSQIEVRTKGVEESFNGLSGMDIFPDYRGISVFSVYQKLDVEGLDWVILTEIDEDEVLQPLNEMKSKLFYISFFLILFTATTSFFIASRLVAPLVRMKTFLTEMSKGKFNIYVKEPTIKDEINEMFHALNHLLHSINGAKNFADSIDNFDFEEEYEPLSQYDTLGKSLIRMRNKLKELKENESIYLLETQKALMEGQDKERFRLSKELHDGLGPLLTALKLSVQSLPIQKKEMEDLMALTDETITEVRRMTYNLMPQSLIDFGVAPSLLKFIEIVRKTGKIDIKYVSSIEFKSNIPTEVNVGLYRIALEAINNTIKHAEATEIKLSITEFDDKVSFFFKDNGKGFDLDKVELGSGILNMQERCKVLKGEFFMTSDKEGTTIEVEIPFLNDGRKELENYFE